MTGPPDGLVTDPANRPPNLPEGNALFAVASRQGRAGSLPAVYAASSDRGFGGADTFMDRRT